MKERVHRFTMDYDGKDAALCSNENAVPFDLTKDAKKVTCDDCIKLMMDNPKWWGFNESLRKKWMDRCR